MAVNMHSDDGTNDIYLYDLEKDAFSRLTFEGNNLSPIWTPDGKRIIFQSNRAGVYDLYWKSVAGSAPAEQILVADNAQLARSISSDGKWVFFREKHPKTKSDIWVLPLEGERKPWAFLQTPFNESFPVLSPDGRWLAYVSDESGRDEVYVRPFPNPGDRMQISTHGGTRPHWSHSGTELFYTIKNKLITATINTKPNFTVETQKVLFSVKQHLQLGYDTHINGEHFVITKPSKRPTQMIMVLNWFEELKRLVPGGK